MNAALAFALACGCHPDAAGTADTGPVSDGDVDDDGWSVSAGDCDDTSPKVYPGAADLVGDAVDSDCDGGDAPTNGTLGPYPAITPDGPYDQYLEFGFDLDVRDVDGDGADDLLVGSQHSMPRIGAAEGMAALVDGASFSTTAQWVGPDIGLNLGWSVAFLTEPAVVRMAIMDDHGFWVFDSQAAVPVVGSPGAHRIERDPDSYLPSVTLAAVDFDADGVDDVAASCGTGDQFNRGQSSVCVFHGPFVEDRTFADVDWVLAEDDSLGVAIVGTDLDADGASDLVAGADHDRDRGAVYVVQGPTSPGQADLSDAAVTWVGENPGDWLGQELGAGDVDGDGDDELLASAMAWPGGAPGGEGRERRGRVYTLELDTPTVADAGCVIDGDLGMQHLGHSMAVDDLDADGRPDLAISSPSYVQLDPTLPGRVLVFFGPVSGHLVAADADLSLAGEADGDLAGGALVTGDPTGDGFADLVVSAPLNDEDEEDAGKVYLLPGPLQ